MQNLNFEKLVTKTGVPLYVLSLPHANSVAAGVLVHAGSRDEVLPNEAGLAHALEHMHFQGTDKFATSKDVHGFMEEIGGYSNAWTSMEGTFYYGQVPAERADRIFIFLSEILEHSQFPEEKIPIEMKNIVEEIKMNHDNPQSYLVESGLSFFYKNHPLGKLPLGTAETVSHFTKSDFLRFKERYYGPENYTFVIAGNIDSATALARFETTFTQHSAVRKNVRMPASLSQTKTTLVEKRKDVQQVNILLLAPLPQAKDDQTTAINMFTSMVSGGASFPLFQEVRDKRGLCYDIAADTDKYSDVSNFSVYIGTDAVRYPEAIKATLDVIASNQTNEDLLRRAKDLRKGRLSLAFENPGQIIDFAAHDIMVEDHPRGYEEIIREIDSITMDNVARAAAQYLKPEQFTTVLLVPDSLDAKE